MSSNSKIVFSEMEIDAIGEIMNISLGSSATSISSMLDKRVNITTPHVQIMKADEFQFKSFEPAIGVEINYISGLIGKNMMILKESDIKVIVGLLLGTDYTQEEFVMDEMSVSAICEVMNQMMGASSTALSQFLNRTVNISTPTSFRLDGSDGFVDKYFSDDDEIVAVSFNLMVEDVINSQFISVLSKKLAKELVGYFGIQEIDEVTSDIEGFTLNEDDIDVESFIKAATQEPPKTVSSSTEPVKNTKPAPRHYQEPPKHAAPAVTVKPASFQNFSTDDADLNENQSENLGLIMGVPLQVSVEIGRTKKKIKDILDFTTGSVIELNRQAGSQVDIFVNGQPIAKGDVVVIDDYYGVRITEILSNSELLKML